MSDVTAYVITTGEPSTFECLARIRGQDLPIELDVIENVAPMDRAFQAMLDRCRTPYFVQVDADMLLDPSAVRTLLTFLRMQPAEVAFVSGWLWDADVQRPIHGVKCYRHAICVRYPYVSDSLSCEEEQFRRMAEDGYRWVELVSYAEVTRADCLGTHFPSQTPEMAFRRWKRCFQKHRFRADMGWLAPYFAQLMEAYRSDPEGITKWKFLGAVAGMTGPIPEPKELDFRFPDQDFRRLSAYVGDWAVGPREINLYVTDRCNFRCEFDGNPCMREVGGPGKGVPHNGEITVGLLHHVLDRWPSIKSACIAGFGEPMMAEEIFGIIDMLNIRGIFVGIITNGALLHRHLDMLEAKSVGYLSVSLNASSAGEHEAMSKTKMWGKVLENIERAAAGPIRTGLSFVCTKHNLEWIPDYLRLALDLRVQFVHLHNILPHGGDMLTFKTSVIHDGDQTSLDALEAAKSLPGAELVEAWPVPISLHPGRNPLRCQSPFVSLGFDGSGAVSGCRRVDPPSIEQGGVHWPDLWDTVFAQPRLELTGDRELPDKCKLCFGNWKE